jgi:hypothetical protein
MEFVIIPLLTACVCKFFFFGLIMFMIFYKETPEEREKREREDSRERGKAFLSFYSEVSKTMKRDKSKSKSVSKSKDKDIYKNNDPEMTDAKEKAIAFMKVNGIESPRGLLEGHIHIRQATSVKDLQTIAAQLVNTYGKRG